MYPFLIEILAMNNSFLRLHFMSKHVLLLLLCSLSVVHSFACDSSATMDFPSYQQLDNGNYEIEIEVCIGIIGSENGWETSFTGVNVVSFSPASQVSPSGNVATGSFSGSTLNYTYPGTGNPDLFVGQNETPCFSYFVEIDGDFSFSTVTIGGVNCNSVNCPGSCSIFGDTLSTFAKPPRIPPDCGGNFYDYGGDIGGYSNNTYTKTTICHDNPGEPVTVTFSSFETEASSDSLKVYNGMSVLSPILAGYAGTVLPAPITSTDASGCLTFEFTSDGSLSFAGWEALLTCICSETPLINAKGNIATNIYAAADSLYSNGRVTAGNNVQFKAVQSIRLDTLFSIEPNADFSAEIEDCRF